MAKKKGSGHASPGDGTLKLRKDGRWEYQVVVGMDVDQKLIRKSFYSRDTSGVGAKEQYREWLSDQREPIEAVKTVKQWAEYWLDTYKKDQVAYKSYKNYCLYVNNHIIPSIGNLKLEDVRPAHIVKMYQARFKLSTSARQHISIALNGIFETAIENRLCTANPAKKARPPKVPKKKPQALNIEQVKKILAFAPTHEFGIYPLGLLYTGCREGELCALRWEDLHLDQNYIDVSKTVAEVEPEGDPHYIVVNGKKKVRRVFDIKECPKSGRDRAVALTPNGVAFFKTVPNTGSYVFGWRERPRKKKEAQKILPIGNTFMNPNKFRHRYMTFFRDLNAYLTEEAKKAGKEPDLVPVMSPHKCRHTYATQLLAGCGNMRAVQEQLGHANISTTEIYTDVDMESRVSNVSKMAY